MNSCRLTKPGILQMDLILQTHLVKQSTFFHGKAFSFCRHCTRLPLPAVKQKTDLHLFFTDFVFKVPGSDPAETGKCNDRPVEPLSFPANLRALIPDSVQIPEQMFCQFKFYRSAGNLHR